MAINPFFPTMAPSASQTPTGAAMNTMGGALGNMAQGIQNQFLSPLLQQNLAQQIQRTSQMQQQTPFAAQLAQNQAISAYPFAQLGFLLQSNPSLLKNPGLVEEISGAMAAQLGHGAFPQLPFGMLGYQPTTPLKVGATNAVTSQGTVTPRSQQQTWPGETGSWLGNQWRNFVNMAKSGASYLNPNQQSSAPQSGSAALLPNSNMSLSQIKQWHGPVSNAPYSVGQYIPAVPKNATNVGIKNGKVYYMINGSVHSKPINYS